MKYLNKRNKRMQSIILLIFIFLIFFSLPSIFSFERIMNYTHLIDRLKVESFHYFNESWPSFIAFNNSRLNGTIYYVFPQENREYVLFSVLKDNDTYYICNQTTLFSHRTVVIQGRVSLVICENGLIRATHFQNFTSGIYSLNVNYPNAQPFGDKFGRLIPGMQANLTHYVGIQTSQKNLNTLSSIDLYYNFTLIEDLDNDSSGLACIFHGQFLTKKAPLQGSFVYLGKNTSSQNSGCCGDDGIDDNFLYFNNSLTIACFRGYAFIPAFDYSAAGINVFRMSYYYSRSEKYDIIPQYIYNFAYFNGTHIVYAEYINFSNINAFNNFTNFYPLNLIPVIYNNTIFFAYCGNKSFTYSNINVVSVDPLNNSASYYIEVSPMSRRFILRNISEISTNVNLGQPVFLCDGTQWRYFVNKSIAYNQYYQRGIKILPYQYNKTVSLLEGKQKLDSLKMNFLDKLQMNIDLSDLQSYNITVDVNVSPSFVDYNFKTNYLVLFDLPYLNRVGFKLIYFNMSR